MKTKITEEPKPEETLQAEQQALEQPSKEETRGTVRNPDGVLGYIIDGQFIAKENTQ